MAQKADATAAVVDRQALIHGVAKYFLEKVYGPDGMPWGTQFAELQELSVQIGQAMSRSRRFCPFKAKFSSPHGHAAAMAVRRPTPEAGASQRLTR